MSKKKSGPGNFDIMTYIESYYNPETTNGKSVAGHINNCIGKNIECKVAGQVIERNNVLQKTTGGIFSTTIYHIKEQKYSTPDICCLERNFLADITRINLKNKLNNLEIKNILRSKIRSCIQHTLSKINDDVKELTNLKEPHIIAIGAFEFSDYLWESNELIKLIKEVFDEESFQEKNMVDAIILYFLPAGCNGKSYGGEICIYSSNYDLTDRLIKYDAIYF